MYEDYYMQQSGSGLPVYAGGRGQRGHGIGSILSGFFRSAVPFLKRGLKFLGKQALKTGAEIANDVADGKDFADSTRKRVSDRINTYVPGFIPQAGNGYPLDLALMPQSGGAINARIPIEYYQSGSGSQKRHIRRANKRKHRTVGHRRDILE